MHPILPVRTVLAKAGRRVQAARKRLRLQRTLKALKPHCPKEAFHWLQAEGIPYWVIDPQQCILYASERWWIRFLPELERATDCHLVVASTIQLPPSLKDIQFPAKPLFQKALKLHASDIFITVNAGQATVQYRCHSSLTETQHLSIQQGHLYIRSILTWSNLIPNEAPHQQEGHGCYRDQGRSYFCRVSYLSTVSAQTLDIRLLNGSDFAFQINDLKLPDDLMQLCTHSLPQWRNGMILISGATGSGKTTTLYALGRWLTQQGRQIISLEDPVEVEMDGWVQSEINEPIGYGFDEALKCILRQDPDVVMIGEIRDSSSAQAAFYASLTGYLVLTTLHVNRMDLTAVRCQELGIDLSEFKNSMRLQIHQQWHPSAPQPTFEWALNPENL